MVNLTKMRTLISIENRIGEKRARVFSKATKITTSITGMPHGGGNVSKVEAGAIELAEIDDAYAEVYSDLSSMRAELSPLIGSLSNPDDIAALRYRYIIGVPLRDIPGMMCVSERAMFYHLSSGEHQLSRLYPDNVCLR